MQEFWFCARCKSMNRAGALKCYKCQAPKGQATLATVAHRQQGVVLTPGLDDEHRELAWTLMFRQTYISAWKLGYLAAALLFALLAVWCALAGASLVAIARVFSVWNTATDPSIGALEGPLGYILGFGVIGAALIAIATLVVHSIFLCLTSINSPALGSGSPRFDPARAAVWWIESYLWAI